MWLGCLVHTDVFEGCEPTEGFESVGEILSSYLVGKVGAELIVVVVIEAQCRWILVHPVHPLDLAVARENSPPDCFLILATPRVVGLL